MAKAKEWKVTLDGIDHEISYKRGLFKSRIIVDGQETPIKSKSAFIQLIDEPISLESKTLNFTVIGTKIDLAVDGVYLNSGKQYVSLGKIPGWAHFITILLCIVGWFFAGIIGILIGLFGSMFVISKSISLDEKNPLPICIGITALCLLIQIVYGVFINVLLYA